MVTGYVATFPEALIQQIVGNALQAGPSEVPEKGPEKAHETPAPAAPLTIEDERAGGRDPLPVFESGKFVDLWRTRYGASAEIPKAFFPVLKRLVEKHGHEKVAVEFAAMCQVTPAQYVSNGQARKFEAVFGSWVPGRVTRKGDRPTADLETKSYR